MFQGSRRKINLAWPNVKKVGQFLVLQRRSLSGYWWEWWLRCGGGASQSGGREGGKIEKWQKHWSEMVFSQLWLMFSSSSCQKIHPYL